MVGIGGNTYILQVLDSGDGTGGQQELLPGAADVDDVDTIGTALVDVLLHLEVHVLRSGVHGGGQHLGDVIVLQGHRVISSRHCYVRYGVTELPERQQ